MRFTHAGWFWFCPVYWVAQGNDGCYVIARWSWLEPLFSVCEALEHARIAVSEWLWDDYEPMFQFRLKPLDKPVDRD